MAWPSGLRRQIKALVRKGEGSNPSVIKSFYYYFLMSTLIEDALYDKMPHREKFNPR